jgi:hypothetical protein
MRSEASTDTVGLSAATQVSFQVTMVELTLVPTNVMWGLSTTTFSLQTHETYEWRKRNGSLMKMGVETRCI